MRSLYASPLRVYLTLGLLALVGIWSGLKLPVSLFPNSAKPRVGVRVSYGSSTSDEFLNSYGRALEDQLRGVTGDVVQLENLKASYSKDRANYVLEFRWGNSPTAALKEVQVIANSFASRLPSDIRDGLGVWTDTENSGFLAISFFSSQRSLDDLYGVLEPVLVPELSKVKDADGAELYNPTQKEIRVELIPEKMASLQLLPRDVEHAIDNALNGFGGGSITVGASQLSVQMMRPVRDLDELGRVIIPTPSGRIFHLADIARIDFGIKTSSSRSFKTNGAPSLILFSAPKPGGNVKRMSEEIIASVHRLMPSLPRDIEYRILVDPSEFIRAAVNNVFHEVAIGAFLAVVILFLFIGSFRNTITAAIEIPLSMVLAFILMRLSGMNLNLISLGGLALSAGMNVDASVVVMENIFRHFEENRGPHDFASRLRIISQAVKEVRFAVIASTIASLVVFLPLAFTSDLSYAILGDLAKTVVFSHGFSAFVALILVPTVRLQLMSRGGEKSTHSPIERHIGALERGYGRLLSRFLEKTALQMASYAGTAIVLGILVAVVLPRLPKEIIGKPDTDWMILSTSTRGNTFIKQMESQTEEVERQLLEEFGSEIQYTFTQINSPNNSTIMARLKDKKEMRAFWKKMEERFTNTPFLRFWVGPWNPAELPIPDPPQLRIAIRGGTLEERAQAAEDLSSRLEEHQVLPRVWTDPTVGHAESVVLRTNPEQWAALQSKGVSLSPRDLADVARVATTGRQVGTLAIAGKSTDIFLRYPDDLIRSPEDLGVLPIGIGSRLVPFKALAHVQIEPVAPTLYREDGREVFVIHGRRNEGSEEKKKEGFLENTRSIIDEWTKEQVTKRKNAGSGPAAYLEDAEKDLSEALRQLGVAVALSVLLIFLTLIVQFGDVVNAILVLVAVPLGFIGVLLSLFVFGSNLSLNSVLGVILLNGIAVANSIILVDFLKRLVDRGMAPREAAVEAARKRLRPILITSLTTILGMLPIAVGMGEGGRILQPLGIAVSGGLWVSMALTLFVVPALQVAYLERRARRHKTAIATLARGQVLAQGQVIGAGSVSQSTGMPRLRVSFTHLRSKISERLRSPEA